MNRVSVNADCRALGSNRQRFIDFIVALRPPYVLLMDDDKCEIADAIHARAPEVTFIHRKFTIHDGNLHRVPQDDGSMLSPQEYLDFLKTHKRPYVIHQVFNEPAPPKGEMVRLLDWLCELMDLAYQQNMRLCTLNMQTVAIRFDELDAGVYDKYLFKCAQYAAFHIAGAHEYGVADVELNTSNHALSYVGRIAEPPRVTWDKVNVNEAHIGRIQAVIDRMHKIGATPIPSVVMTEYGDDKVEITDISIVGKDGTVYHYDPYHEAIGLNNGKVTLGLPSLRDYAEERYALTITEFAIAQFRWTNDTFPDYVKGFCWFGWNYNPEWAGFNVGELVDLQREWILYADRGRLKPPPVPPPAPPPSEPLTLEQQVALLTNLVNQHGVSIKELEATVAQLTGDHR